MSYLLGIDLGGSSVKTVAVTPDGRLLAQSNLEFDAAAEMDWARTIAQVAEEIQTAQGERAANIGLSAPGLAAPDGRSIACMPGRLQGLEGLDWTVRLNARQPVPVLNDAQAALVGGIL